MYVTIINDCQDDNAAARQMTRVSNLFNVTPSFVGVKAYNELEAAGNLIDALDASEAGEGVILVNIAPRHGRAKKWPNGTPFGYFYVGKTLVVASLDGLTLSLVKKLKLTDEVRHIDIPETTARMVKDGKLTDSQRDQIIRTQFRSFDYLPRVARYLWDLKAEIGEAIPIQEFEEAPEAVWWVDNFGNCKTTLLLSDLPKDAEAYISQHGTFKLYDQLRDVPDGEAGMVIGSSGFQDARFLELVEQGGPANHTHGLQAGDFLNAPL